MISREELKKLRSRRIKSLYKKKQQKKVGEENDKSRRLHDAKHLPEVQA